MKCQIGHGDVALFFLYADFYNRHTEKNDYATDIVYRNTCRCHCFRFGVQVEEKGRKQNG